MPDLDVLEPSDELEEEYDPDLILLEDENGEQHTFEVIDATEVGEHRYLAVLPYEESPSDEEEDADMIVMRVGEEDGGEYLDIVDDPDELSGVIQVFLNRLSELYDIDLAGLEPGL